MTKMLLVAAVAAGVAGCGVVASDDSAAAAARGPKPVKVFILAGQSNMEGQAVVDLDHEKYYNGGRGILNTVMEDPAKAHLYKHLKDDAGEWTVRDDVRVWFRTGRGDLKTGGVTIGFTAYGGKHHFGPELQFGHVVGDRFEEPVLLVKTAWGGKSIYKDFRPPRSGGDVGPFYTRMLAEIREALADVEAHAPGWGERGHEIVGLVWFQGWNDMCEKAAVPVYEENLANLIKDVREELALPGLAVVIGETGNCNNMTFRRAQGAVAKRADLAGTVSFVETERFRRAAKESPNVGHGHHWFGNAESYFLIGNAFGEAMMELLDAKAGPPELKAGRTGLRLPTACKASPRRSRVAGRVP